MALDDLDFLPARIAANRRRGRLASHALVILVVAFFAVAIYWASQARLDEVTRGEARIIPTHQVQIVQNLEGGILAELLVAEGEVVEEDQILLRLTDARATAELAESRVLVQALSAEIARLAGEAAGKEAPDFPAELSAEAPTLVANELALMTSRRANLENEIPCWSSSASNAARRSASCAAGAISWSARPNWQARNWR